MRYVVRFLKTVLGENGREQEVCQGWYEIEADGKDAAIELGKDRFCAAAELAHWQNHADRIQIEEAEFSS